MRFVSRPNAGQVDLRRSAEIPPQQGEFHQVDSIDLQVARCEVAEFEVQFDRVAAGGDRQLRQSDSLAEELLDRGPDALLMAAVRLIHRVPDKLAPAPAVTRTLSDCAGRRVPSADFGTSPKQPATSASTTHCHLPEPAENWKSAVVPGRT